MKSHTQQNDPLKEVFARRAHRSERVTSLTANLTHSRPDTISIADYKTIFAGLGFRKKPFDPETPSAPDLSARGGESALWLPIQTISREQP